MLNKRILLTALLIFSVFAFIGAQQSRSETTAEEDYLSTFEDMIISELTISEEYDNKILALQYIEADKCLERGNTGDMEEYMRACKSLQLCPTL